MGDEGGTGACITGAGGVFLALDWSMSRLRTTFLPSILTSNESLPGSALFPVVPEITPPRDPAWSPTDLLKLEPFRHAGAPLILTLFDPLARSLLSEILG